MEYSCKHKQTQTDTTCIYYMSTKCVILVLEEIGSKGLCVCLSCRRWSGRGVWFMTLKCSVGGLRRSVGMRFHGYCSISV